MAKSKSHKGRPQLRGMRSEAEINLTIEALNHALMGGDATRVTALIDQLTPDGERAAEVLAQRIIAGEERVHTFSLSLLSTLAGEATPSYLERIANDRSAIDLVRFCARQRVGWPEKGEAKRRLAFLETLGDPDDTLLLAIEQAMFEWPPDVHLLDEILGYLAAFPPERRQAVAGRMARELGERATWLLRAILHINDKATQLLTLNELVRLRDFGSVGAIGRLAQTARAGDVRQEAAAAARRLGVRVIGEGKPAERAELPGVERVLLSLIDGDGSQVLLVVRRLVDDLFLVVDFLHNDRWGIKDVSGAMRADVEELAEIMGTLEEEHVQMVDVDLAAARGTLSAAIEVNRTTGRALPRAFELWEPLVHDSFPPSPDEAVKSPEIDDSPYVARADLIRQSAKLADHDFFQSWLLDTERTAVAMALAPAPGVRLTAQQYRPLIESITDREARASMRQRLRRQAWLLDHSGDATARDLALAVAAQLGAGKQADLVKQPFLRAMVDRTVEAIMETVADEFDEDDDDDFEDD